MPLPSIYRSGGSGFGDFGTSSSPNSATSMFGVAKQQGTSSSFFAPKITKPKPERTPFEKFEVGGTDFVNELIQQPARIAERPVAFADMFTGGAASSIFKGVGDAGGDKNGPGPIGSIVGALGDVISAPGQWVSALWNSGDAMYAARYADKPDNFVLPADPFSGIGARGKGPFGMFGQMTAKDLRDDLAARRFNTDENGQTISWEEVMAKARDDAFAFGDKDMSGDVALNMAEHMVTDPTNLLFFLPVAGWAAKGLSLGSKAMRAFGIADKLIIPTVKVADWARPALTGTSKILTPLRYGHGYIKDMSYLGTRTAKLPAVSQSARSLLAGQVADGSLRGLATAIDMTMRGSKALLLPGFKRGASVGATFDAAKTAYFKGALRLQVGSVAAEFGSGRINDMIDDSALEGTIVDGLTSTVHDALHNVNNARPLSSNEVFTILAAVSMPAMKVVGQELDAGVGKVRSAIGDNDAVLFAKQLVPDVKGKAAVTEMYKRFGKGDVERGKQVFNWVLDTVDAHKANHDMSLVNRTVSSMDSVANRAAFLKPILLGKIDRMRAAKSITANERMDIFNQIIKYGGPDNPRNFEFNAKPDEMIAAWSRMHDAAEKFAGPLSEFGDLTLSRSGLVTKEIAEELKGILKSYAGKDGFVPQALANEVLGYAPGLMTDPAYGAFWQRLAGQGERASTSGKVTRNPLDERVKMSELESELDKLSEKLPSEDELFHEAKQLEVAQIADVAPLRQKLRRVHSVKQVKELRDDATGSMRTLRQEQKVLANIRNSEFTRNGTPKRKSLGVAVGYNGSIFKKVSGANNEVEFMARGRDGGSFTVLDNGAINMNVPDPNVRSEALVKAVELGGRTIVDDTFRGEFYAVHGFTEVGRINGLGFYAYVGGAPGELRNHLGGYVGPVKMIHYQGISMEVPRDPEIIRASELSKIREVDREVTPKLASDPLYLDRLTDEIKSSGVIEPVEVTYDPYFGRAMLTDGNHRLAVAKRLGMDVPVRIILDRLSPGEGFQVRPAPDTTLTARGMLGIIDSDFPKYRPSKRVFKKADVAFEFAQRRALQASLRVPSVDAIGPSPFNAEGTFHGSVSKFDEFEDMRRSSDFIGAGTFTTDDASIASGYALQDEALGYGGSGRGDGYLYKIDLGENPKTMHMETDFPKTLAVDVKVPADKKIYDLHQPTDPAITADIVSSISAAAESELRKVLDGMLVHPEGYQDVIASYQRMIDNIPERMADVADTIGESTTLFDLYRRIYDHDLGGVSSELPMSTLNNIIREAVRSRGYDGLVHIGSIVTNDGAHPHGVLVMFDPKDVPIADRIHMKDAVPLERPRFKQITDRVNVIRDQMKEQQKRIAAIDQRAEELRTITLPDNLTDAIPEAQQQKLRELISEQREMYPELEVKLNDGPVLLNPNDGPLPGLQLERSYWQSLLYDYGPMSKMSALYNSLFSPVSSRRLARDARQAVFNLSIGLGASDKQVQKILTELNNRVRENVVGPMRVPYFRGITALPANTVNEIARAALNDATWSRVSQKYGTNGFHRLLDEASNELVRKVDIASKNGKKVGRLSRALRDGYRMWEYAPAVGSGSRLISKTWYHMFRFMMDVRWHVLNLVEADALGASREGIMAGSRFGTEPSDVAKNALMSHTALEDLPSSFLTGTSSVVDGPSHAMDLFDAGLFLHNRNLMPVLERHFDKARLDSVADVLNNLGDTPQIKLLRERFGDNPKLWSEQLDDMMYSFDTRGVDATVKDSFQKVADELGWTKDEMKEMAPVLEKISEKNQAAYDDIVALYNGNLHRTRLERVLNSYWLYWPLSYQIKAAKWLYGIMLNRMGGRQTNMLGAVLFDRAADTFKQSLATNPKFAQQMEDESDLWFTAMMLFPITPMDTGITLNKGVRYVGSLAAPDVVPEYASVHGYEDIPKLILEMGPVYTANLLANVVKTVSGGDSKKKAPSWAQGLKVH